MRFSGNDVGPAGGIDRRIVPDWQARCGAGRSEQEIYAVLNESRRVHEPLTAHI